MFPINYSRPVGATEAELMKGWRNITVNGHDLRWLFVPTTATIKLRGLSNSVQSAEIELKGWKDPWINFPETNPGDSYAVTPELVREVVEFAFASGWDPTSKTKLPKLVFDQNRS
ncbi:MAG: hypothetical protein AB7Q37_15575 [Pyrinomonadaceae bacterium]